MNHPDNSGPESRRLDSPEELPGGRRRHGGIHHRAAARAGRPGHASPKRQAQHRGGGRRRHGKEQRRQERDREHRRLVRRRLRPRRPGLQEIPERQAVQGLSRHAGRAEGHRRRHHRDTRSQPRRDCHGGHAAEEARVRAEAADSFRSRGPAPDRNRPEVRRGDPDGQPGALGRRHPPSVRVGVGRRHRPHS